MNTPNPEQFSAILCRLIVKIMADPVSLRFVLTGELETVSEAAKPGMPAA
jgi:hypothetical protein